MSARCIDWQPTIEPYGWCSCGTTVKRHDWLAHRAADHATPETAEECEEGQ